jgi:phage head maturation protease/predicted RNA-binding Zn-ribbon protein involved in translation (DUF1610 family)
MIKKFIEAEVKALEEGNFEVTASSGKTDRLGDTIDPKGWYLTNYKKNPVILWSHSSGGFGTAAIPPVAKADKVWVENEKELKIKGHFADTPFAQELRTLVEGGFLNAVSVGFLPLVEEEKGDIEIEEKTYRRATDEEIEKGVYREDGEHFTKQELLEVSWVSVPALATALVSARKEMKLPLLTKALEEAKSKDAEEETEIKPYPNEHSCRLENPNKYKRFRRQNCQRKHDGKCIDVIWGITKGEEEKTETQALRYDKKIWTEESARTHCKGEKGTFEPAGESKNETFECECLDCGHKITTERHCADIKCPKCGGEMRRVERPGPGKEIKEGRVISGKNRKLISSCIATMEEAISSLKELLEATEPEKGTTPLELKGRKPFIKQKSTKPDLERLLIMFDKMCEALLRKLRQNSEND